MFCEISLMIKIFTKKYAIDEVLKVDYHIYSKF